MPRDFARSDKAYHQIEQLKYRHRHIGKEAHTRDHRLTVALEQNRPLMCARTSQLLNILQQVQRGGRLPLQHSGARRAGRQQHLNRIFSLVEI